MGVLSIGRRMKAGVLAASLVFVALGVAIAADSATSAAGVIDTRFGASGGASAVLLETRSGAGQEVVSAETPHIDTATSIGIVILLR